MTTPAKSGRPTRTRVEVVRLEGYTLGRFNFQPGRRWSACVKLVVGTESCQVAHVGYVVAGRIVVRMNDGSQTTIEKGMSYTIPPGHDAWVEGNEPFGRARISSHTSSPEPSAGRCCEYFERLKGRHLQSAIAATSWVVWLPLGDEPECPPCNASRSAGRGNGAPIAVNLSAEQFACNSFVAMPRIHNRGSRLTEICR